MPWRNTKANPLPPFFALTNLQTAPKVRTRGIDKALIKLLMRLIFNWLKQYKIFTETGLVLNRAIINDITHLEVGAERVGLDGGHYIYATVGSKRYVKVQLSIMEGQRRENFPKFV
jgi:hypothetical protein